MQRDGHRPCALRAHRGHQGGNDVSHQAYESGNGIAGQAEHGAALTGHAEPHRHAGPLRDAVEDFLTPSSLKTFGTKSNFPFDTRRSK